ncbi:MAG: ATP-binding cassette domain-containing protein [Clostridiales bacterium]|nr:ATP-binding cassette domain-containing protein [Clostridiales bacterium]
MEDYKIENLSFAYPNRENKALDGICLNVKQGEFITLCGKSGCGKTTLLRLLKTSLAPFGDLDGRIYFKDKLLSDVPSREQAADIGFVMQSPDNQIVTDKVWHELAFGLESLGYSTPEIRTRVSEMASFFGIQTWFHKKVTELSGGQKQLLNLASVMVMQPSVLVLDEPTSQLDPIAAQEFLKTLEKINLELGTTVILSEHRLEDAFPVSDRVIVMDKGKIIADREPQKVGEILKETNHDMYRALPVPMRVYGAVDSGLKCPVTVRDGREWLEGYCENNPVNVDLIPKPSKRTVSSVPALEIRDAYFRYEKNLPYVIKGLNIKINRGELFAIVGGNGTGKTTALSLMSGLNTSYRGEVLINGESIFKVNNLYNGVLSLLPQNPQSVFVKKTVYLDLLEILSEKKISKDEKETRIKSIAALCCIEDLLDAHPYDLSGGEQQRAALAKVLLCSPQILLLDEPTKGLDAHFKQIFADILNDLKAGGTTVIMVSHDIEFCAEYADCCAMFFDGSITSYAEPREFFTRKCFYTTAANRMARTRLPEAVLAEDIIRACGGCVPKRKRIEPPEVTLPKEQKNKKPSGTRIAAGVVFGILFILTCIVQLSDISTLSSDMLQWVTLAEAAGAIMCFFGQRKIGIKTIKQPQYDQKLSKRSLIAAVLMLLAIPLTIYVGVFYLRDRKYYFISLLIILETMLPFFVVYEGRKHRARELVIISVMCAIAVAGRAAFFMLPQFKPVAAVVIIAGVCFGAEAGFLVGAVVGFVSNFFFGQGPWTPWQMFAFGLIGFIGGILFKKGFLRKTKASLCIFGAAAVLVIYGGIMNPASVIMWQEKITKEMIFSAYIMGLPFDLIHAASTAFFLWVISEPMIDKLERIKLKYGLLDI